MGFVSHLRLAGIHKVCQKIIHRNSFNTYTQKKLCPSKRRILKNTETYRTTLFLREREHAQVSDGGKGGPHEGQKDRGGGEMGREAGLTQG